MDRGQIGALRHTAAGQHGLFTTAQARHLGVSRSELEHAADHGWVRRVRRRVYAFTGHPRSRWEEVQAACLSAGPAAVISHASAATVHGFWGIAFPGAELTLPGPAGRSLAGVRVHRTTSMPSGDVVRRSGVQVTAPVRTVIDLAGRTNEHLLGRIIDEGAIARLWTVEEIGERLLEAAGGRRPGVRRLRRLLAVRLGEGHPDSPLEQRVFRVMKPQVPTFEVHHRIDLGGRVVELDMAWPEYRIAGEIEGRRLRMESRTKFDSERLRSNLLERYGWREVHLTAAMDDKTLLAQVVPLFPDGVVDRRVLLDLRRRTGPGESGKPGKSGRDRRSK
jgi:hypothetical protein